MGFTGGYGIPDLATVCTPIDVAMNVILLLRGLRPVPYFLIVTWHLIEKNEPLTTTLDHSCEILFVFFRQFSVL